MSVGQSVFQDANLRDLVAAKERELHEIHEFRLVTLERTLAEREGQLVDASTKLAKLREDFKYNLSLFEGRDAELARYESTLEGVRACLSDKEVEASELRSQLDELAGRLTSAQKREDEQAEYWSAKCKNLKDEIDSCRWRHEEELRAAREATESLRAQLAHHSRRLEEELEAQRRDMSNAFDDMMRQREDEARRRDAEYALQLEEHQRRAGDASRSADRAGAEAVRLKAEMERLARALTECQQSLRTAKWEVDDQVKQQSVLTLTLEEERAAARAIAEATTASHEERIKELLASLHAVETAFVQQQVKTADTGRKLADMELALVASKSRENQLREDVDCALAKHDVLQADLIATQTQLVDESAARDALEKELSARSQELGTLRAASSTARIRIQDLEQALGASEVRIASENASRNRQISILEAEVSALKTQSQDLNTSKTEQVTSLLQKTCALEEDLNSARVETQEAVAQASEYKQKMDELEAAFEARAKEFLADREDVLARLRDAERVTRERTPPSQKPASSPMFSEDMGPASPLPPVPGLGLGLGLSPRGGMEGFASEEDRSWERRARELEVTNGRLRDVIVDMRKEVENVRASAFEKGSQGSLLHHPGVLFSYVSRSV